MKNVLFITGAYPDLNRRNNYTFSHELVRAISDSGVKIEVINLKSSESRKPETDIYDGVKVHRVNYKWNPVNHFEIYKQIKKISKSYNNIVFSFLYPMYLPLLPIFKGKNILLITHGGDIMLRWDNWLRRLIKKKVLKRVDQYFPVSNATALYLEHFVPNSKLENIHTLYNGINREKFSGCRKKDEIRKSLNIPETTCLLLTVCNLIPRKGVDILLNADKLLDESDFNYLHIIVGRGSEEERLKNLAKENKISNSVKFIPYIESDQELAELFIASDLYVMMSRTEHNKMAMEGFGIVYAEAQYCGTPVIAGNTGGVPSAVRDDFTGYLISPSNPDAPTEIKEKIINLINDSEKYNRFSENARNFVSNSFDWDKYVTFLHNFLK